MTETTHIVSFSGGRSSRRLVHLVEQLREAGHIAVEYVFMDTGAEHPATYDFIREVVEHYGIDLTCLRAKFGPLGVGTTYSVIPLEDIRPDLTPWREMVAKYSTPYYPGGAFCTDQLKGIPCKKYLADKYKGQEIVEWWGIRVDEPVRLKEVKGRPNVHYLAELCTFEKEDVIAWSAEQPVDLRIEHSDVTGNCVFCIKRRPNKIALAAKLEPELATEFINLIEDPSVRVIEDRKAPVDAMYRGKMSLRNIASMAEKSTVDELKMMIKGMGGHDAGGCSESCEAINSNNRNLTEEMVQEET